MRLERINSNQFKVFLNNEELMERGITRIDFARHTPEIHQFFYNIVDEACVEMSFDVEGHLLIEVYTFHIHGVLILIKKSQENSLAVEDDDEFGYSLSIQILDRKPTIYHFAEFEHVIQVCHILKSKQITEGKLLFFDGFYYLILSDTSEEIGSDISALLSEFGEVSTLTISFLEEYAKMIIQEQTVINLTKYFSID